MEQLKHECGVAMIRLRKPLEYYQQKYGTWMWGLNKLYLLMEKQHNRGQEGAGMACVKLEAAPGEEYIFRERAEGTGAITEIFDNVHSNFIGMDSTQLVDASRCKGNVPFAGEIYMGHLRYSTTGRSGLSYVHPFLRRNNWRAKNLLLCGNFNMTNVDHIFEQITATGQHPRKYADTFILLEQVGHRLDREVERLYEEACEKGLKGMDITAYIEQHINLANVLRHASKDWDGGYVICGATGSGESFALRDPWGIRSAFYYIDEEVCVLASERPVIQTVFNVSADEISELAPGQALLMNKKGDVHTEQINEPRNFAQCSFERIYFSRGSDKDIYNERKEMGSLLKEGILKAVGGDIENSVFSFIPNTAEVAFYGMMGALNDHLNHIKADRIIALGPDASKEEISSILSTRLRSEKVAIKDIKLRTFIAEGNSRNDLAAHVYDITYGSLRAGIDNLVVIDDSIVRGTTLKQSIIGILDRLGPRKIVIVSAAPIVKYSDYYGIDMSSLEEFIAFRAAVALLKEHGKEEVLEQAYKKALAQDHLPGEEMENCVRSIYDSFTDEELTRKIEQMLTPEGINAEVEIVYQKLDDLHKACPGHPGDWYFSGNYPTPGGKKMLNKAFIRFMQGKERE